MDKQGCELVIWSIGNNVKGGADNPMSISRFISGIVAFFILLTMAMNIPKITREYSDVKKIGSSVVRHAEKNGGFRTETLKLLNEMLVNYGLDKCVKDFSFSPGIDVDVQKRERFDFQLTYTAEYTIPFADKGRQDIHLKFFGYSHKFFKP